MCLFTTAMPAEGMNLFYGLIRTNIRGLWPVLQKKHEETRNRLDAPVLFRKETEWMKFIQRSCCCTQVTHCELLNMWRFSWNPHESTSCIATLLLDLTCSHCPQMEKKLPSFPWLSWQTWLQGSPIGLEREDSILNLLQKVQHFTHFSHATCYRQAQHWC